MTFYIILLFIFLSIFTFLFVYLFRNKSSLATNFSLYSIASIIYLTGTVGVLFSNSVEMALIFQKIKYFGLNFIAPTFILFLYRLNRISIGKLKLFALYAIPFLTLIFITTADSHTLFYKSYDIAKFGNFTLFTSERGVFYYINASYMYLLNTFTLFLIHKLFTRKENYSNNFAILLLINFVFVISLDTVYFLNVFPKGFDVTTFVYIFQLIIYILAIFYYDIFNPDEYSVSMINDGVIMYDDKLNLLYSNKIANNYFPWLIDLKEDKSLIGTPIEKKVLSNKKSFICETTINDEVCYLKFNRSTIQDKSFGEKDLTIYIISDATNESILQAELEIMIKLDGLTNIYNQSAILNKVEEKYDLAVNNDYTFIIGMLDINNFKQVNDKYGHLFGNKVIVKIAEEIKELFSCGKCIYGRFGGDEFIIATYNLTLEEFSKRAHHFSQNINKTTDEDLIEAKISVSFGASFIDFNEHKNKPNYLELIDTADKAMYESKRNKNNNPIIFKI